MVTIDIPAINASGGKYEWATYSYVPSGCDWLALEARPGAFRTWLAKKLAEVAAHIGGRAVLLNGVWSQTDPADSKAAVAHSIARARTVFVRSVEQELNSRFADRALDEALAAEREAGQ